MKRTRFFLVLFLLLAELCSGQSLYDHTIKPADAMPDKYLPLLKGKKVALLINQTSRVGDSLLVDMLLARKVDVVKIFVPEHGFRGTEDAGAKIDNSTDDATHLPVISLYGKHQKATPEDMAGIDVVVYDLQDVGVRFYTYISTLEYMMEACCENRKQLIILDRPNPNGFYVDGPVLEPANKSFVGMQPIPVVYGMTVAEYAEMLEGKSWVKLIRPLDMKVIKCANYDHSKHYELPVPPSPNLTTMAAIYAYPALCLFEGTPISVGRGTALPFRQFGCPEFEGKFTHEFIPRSMEGAKNPPYEGKSCYGELVATDAAEVLKKLNNHLLLDWLIKAYNAYPDKDKFFTTFFVKLTGTTKLRDQLKGGATEEEIRKSWHQDLRDFKRIRKKYLLYRDFE